MLALVDGDIVCYRCACSCEDIPTLAELAAMDKNIDDRESLIVYEPVESAYMRIDVLMKDILEITKSDKYRVFLSGDHDFRVKVNPEYKANRKDARKPRYLEQCKEYLIVKWGAEVTDEYEADDALGINQTDDTIICTIDKDLLQIPGLHYNFVTQEIKNISTLEGKKHLWKQMLIGDTVDNIIGVYGIGKVKASAIIDPLEDEYSMYEVVYDLYKDHDRFNMNLKCLTILTEELNAETGMDGG